MSTHFYPGPSNIFNFSWIKCARSGLQVLENMYLFTKHQLYSQTSCFYLHVFEIIHDKNITATCLPTKLALKILIMNGSFLPNSQKQAINYLHTNEHLSRFDGQLILPYMTPAQLEMEDGDVVDVFQARSSLFLAKLVVGDLVMVFLFILWKAVIEGGIVFTAAGGKGKNILNKQLNILQA